MTIPAPPTPDQRDVSPTLSSLHARIEALRADLDAFSADRKAIWTLVASLVFDVKELEQAVAELCSELSPTTAAQPQEYTT